MRPGSLLVERVVDGSPPIAWSRDHPWEHNSAFDTHAITRAPTDAKLTPAQADAITDAVRQAAEHGEDVTPDILRAETATLRADLPWRIVAVGGLVVAALRLLG